MNPQEEAIQIFADVIRDLTSDTHNIKIILRRCQFACQLLSWSDQMEWFQRELGDYPTDTPIPFYRKVYGLLKWREKNNPYNVARRIAELTVYGEPYPEENEGTELEIWQGIDFLLSASEKGHIVLTEETKEGWSSSKKTTTQLQRVKEFRKEQFSTVIAEIERATFDFASQSYSTLRYGNLLTDIWSDYRNRVESTLQRLGLSAHLDAIQVGLQSDNSESWRQAVFGCRNLLSDVANYLWCDPRNTYEYLPGSGAKGKLGVSRDNSKNRLEAYLHQKGLRGRSREFLQAELERLVSSIRSLIDFQSKAHAPITKEDARSVAIFTYLILGELVIRTDMKPIEEYGTPAIKTVPPDN